MSTPPAELWDLPSTFAALQQTRWAGVEAVARARRSRIGELIRYARERSVWFGRRCAGLPADVGLERMPVTRKAELMARFDEWVTDPAVSRAAVESFFADRSRIGERFLGRYVAWRSSGTSGEPGYFVHDGRAVAVYDALIGAIVQAPPVSVALGFGMLAHAGRCALVAAIGEHFAGIVTWRSIARWVPAPNLKEISILAPLTDWVDELNAFQPAFLAGYPSALRLLAREQGAGRLSIAPSIVWSGGEHLGGRARSEIERAFAATVVEEYGSSECPSIAAGCDCGWLHVNDDWVVLEAVDERYRPVAPGTRSHTVLLTNLANRVQPLIRYDLGDRIVVRPDACECGNPMPAVRVEGRAGDALSLVGRRGRRIDVLPLAIETALEEEAGIHRFQVVRRGPSELSLRLPAGPARTRRDAWRRARDALGRWLDHQGLANVTIALDAEPPRVDATSGKLAIVVSAPMAGRRRARPGRRGAPVS